MVVFKFRNLRTSQAMPIPEGEFLVGRIGNAYVHVDDPSVSRNHARLFNNKEGFFIEDLGSANGTAMRGAFLTTRTKIDFGNIVHIGSVPFRIDPEVAGQIEVQPPPSARNVDLDSMRRDTERLPPIGETPWAPEAIPPDQLAAPVVSATDNDADDLNAITIRDPEPTAPATLTPVQTATLMSVPTLQRSVAPQEQARRQALLEAEEMESSLRPSAPWPAPENPGQGKNGAPHTNSGRIWYLVTFFAGLGVGLLLGLIFAKIFFEMGGEPSGLP